MTNKARKQMVKLVRNDYRRTVYQIKRTGGVFLSFALENAKRIYQTAMHKLRLMTGCSRKCEPYVNLLLRNVGIFNHNAISV